METDSDRDLLSVNGSEKQRAVVFVWEPERGDRRGTKRMRRC